MTFDRATHKDGRIIDSVEEGAAIKIKVGLADDDNEANLGGTIAAAYGWDQYNHYLGQGTGSHIDEGGVYDVTIGSSVPGKRAIFVGLSGGNNAICMAWVTVSQFDGTLGDAWTGDIGSECGQDWYENGETAGYLDKDQTMECKPRCTWLDGDHTNDIPSAAVKFRTDAYGLEVTVTDTVKNGQNCDASIWGADTGLISAAPPAKRSLRPRLPRMEERLIVSNFTGHLAENMCSSPTSWGPDFVGSDGMFCDMGLNFSRSSRLCAPRKTSKVA